MTIATARPLTICAALLFGACATQPLGRDDVLAQLDEYTGTTFKIGAFRYRLIGNSKGPFGESPELPMLEPLDDPEVTSFGVILCEVPLKTTRDAQDFLARVRGTAPPPEDVSKNYRDYR